jgi:hypothetical protein
VYILRAVFRLLLLDSAELALFTGRLVKSLIMTLKGFEPLRRFYEGFGLKPFRATPLLHCSTGAIARGRVEAGEALCFEVSYASQDISGVQSLASVDEDVKVFSSRARVEAKNIEIVTADNLTIGFRNPQDQVIKIDFETPTLLSVKLMTPPVPEIQKRLAKARTLYMLFPSPAHICSYLRKTLEHSIPNNTTSTTILTRMGTLPLRKTMRSNHGTHRLQHKAHNNSIRREKKNKRLHRLDNNRHNTYRKKTHRKNRQINGTSKLPRTRKIKRNRLWKSKSNSNRKEKKLTFNSIY